MQSHRSLLLILLLALAPRPGEAEALRGSTPIMPIQPSGQGFVSLFQSPPPRIVRDPPGAAPTAVAAPPAAAPSVPASASALIAAGAMCRPALVAAERRYGVPTGLLQAIGVVESGRRDDGTGVREPWPWTINAEGEGHYFDTREQAIAWVQQAQARGIRSIDIGCAQVNLMYHPTAFASLQQAFDPTTNADYAARFLRELHDTTAGGNWMTAAGHYHSQTPELADGYRQQVQAAMARGNLPVSTAPVVASSASSVPPFASAAPTVPGNGRSEPARLLPAPVGTVGRGLDAYRAMPIQLASIVRVPAPSMDRSATTGPNGLRSR